MCGWCRIFDSASRIFGKSSTVVSDVEFLMQRIKCINYVCLHGSRQTEFFFWMVDSNAQKLKLCSSWRLLVLGANVCFKTTKYTCLDCGLHFCIPCSVFEEDEEVPGWMAGRCVARCDACFRELLEEIGDRGDQVVKERQTPEIGTPDENSQNGKKRKQVGSIAQAVELVKEVVAKDP